MFDIFSDSGNGLPAPLSPIEVEMNLAGAAKATVESRHAGPRTDHSDSLQRIVDQVAPDADLFPNSPRRITAESPPRSLIDSPILRDSASVAASSSHPGYKTKKEIIYFQKCDFCDWISTQTPDAQALTGLVEEKRLHMSTAHNGGPPLVGNVGVANEARPVAEREDYQLATAPRIIAEGIDDRKSQFSEGRFLMGPLNWKNVFSAMPLSQEPTFARIDLGVIGTPTLNANTIARAHSRAARDLSLDNFSAVNLKRNRDRTRLLMKPNGFEEGDGFVELVETSDAVLAVSNYVDVMRFLHPLDYGPQALFKVVLERFVIDDSQAEDIKKFFAACIEENAGRAVRGELPMSYNDCKTQWKMMPENKNEDRDGLSPAQFDRLKKQLFSEFKKNKSNGGPPHKKQRLPYCGKFNLPKGCPYKKTEEGCRSPDNFLARHACNVKVNGVYCGAKDHNANSHK